MSIPNLLIASLLSKTTQTMVKVSLYPFRANGAETGSIGGGSARTGDDYLEMTLLLKRGDGGFGFRVVGGDEEGSQVL